MARKTGVQEDRGYTQTDDFITRTHVLPLLSDASTRRALIAEHRDNPIGTPGKNGRAGIQHSKDLQTVLDKLRRQPMPGKYVRICVKAHEDYRIGVVSGVRGKPVKILSKSFPDEDACEHGIFVKRVNDLMKEYGIK